MTPDPELTSLLNRLERGIAETTWIDVVGDEGHIMVRADDDWRPLLEQLARRCPQAEVTNRE